MAVFDEALHPLPLIVAQPVNLNRVARYAAGLICAQRELREPLLTGEDPVCFVGGYVMHTTVTKDGVSTSKGASFPDVAGRRIHATRGDTRAPPGRIP